MDEEEHEVYGGEIPVEGEMEGEMDGNHGDTYMTAADEDPVKVFALVDIPVVIIM